MRLLSNICVAIVIVLIAQSTVGLAVAGHYAQQAADTTLADFRDGVAWLAKQTTP